MSPDVVAGILRRGDTVLLVHRRSTRAWYPDVWDLPGGHVHAGEPAGRALERELAEELGVRVVTPIHPTAEARDAELRLRVWTFEHWVGDPANHAPDEHDAIGWFDAAGLEVLPLADDRLRPLLRRALDQSS